MDELCCSVCGEIGLPLTKGMCNKCYGKTWRAANAEHVKEYGKEWRAANAEYGKDYGKKWRTANPEYTKEYGNKWRATNIDHIAEHDKEYRKNNQERISAQKKEYRLNNLEHFAARDKVYRDNHKDTIAAYQKEYRDNNKENLSAYSKAYRELHRDEFIARDKEYYENTRDASIPRKGSIECSIAQSCRWQGITIESWDGYANEHRYCKKFNHAFKESIREKFGRRCFLCDKTEEENGARLSVHHTNFGKRCICDFDCLFVPLCRSCHAKTNANRFRWFSLIMCKLHLESSAQFMDMDIHY